MVIITKAPFITMPACTIVGMRSRPHTPRGIDLVSMHTKMPRKVNKIFVGHTSNPKGGESKTIETFKTFRTFKIFWIANDGSK
jgi:hypothetical protein